MKSQHFTSALRNLGSRFVGLAVTALGSYLALATPYATCLTNNAGVISFRLNEDADGVKVIWNNGANTNDLGARPKGLTITADLGVTGAFKVEVSKSAGAGYLQGVVNQISVDSNNFVKFANGRGVAVNVRPASPYFGRVYVACGSAGTVSSNQFTLGSRATGDGIYVLNADQTDAVGQGNSALTGGINFSTSGENPHRLAVGKDDDNLYISDFSDASGTLYVTDPDCSPNSGTNVLDGLGGPFPVTSTRIHGSMNGAVVEGTRGNNLTVYVIDEDLQEDRDNTVKYQLNSIWRWDIGTAALPFTAWPPTRLISPGVLQGYAQTCELRRGPDGKFYVTQRRADPASTAGAFVISADGQTQLWDSITATQELLGDPSARDLLNESVGMDVSQDGKYLAVFKRSTNSVSILPLTDGIPDITNMVVMPTVPTTVAGRALAFDAAGNIYTLSSGQGLLRIYSRGGTTVATTGSDGTFSVYAPIATSSVSVTAPDDQSSEAGPDNATFTITRTSTDISQSLMVRFSLAGTAVRGTDYVLQTNGVVFTGNSVDIPANASSVDITLVPTDDSVAEYLETAVLNLNSSINYGVTAPASATVSLADNEPATIDATGVVYASMFEAVTNDYIRFTLSRRGDVNAGPFDVNVSFSGTAAAARYSAPATVMFDPGVITTNFDIYPVNDNLLQGNQTILCGVIAGTGYAVGSNYPAASAVIIDDEVPAETVLYSEDFNSDNSANWTMAFAAMNSLPDSRYLFNYDYSSGTMPVTGYPYPVLPPAPRSGSDTHGLYLTVNKDEGSGTGAAGINLYPTGRSFSGDFAVRFDMYLMVGTSASTTEYALFGINHDGTHTNWFRNTAPAGVPPDWVFDGLWYGVEADGAALGDYVLYSAPITAGNNPTALVAVNASAFENIFKNPPYGGGLPGAPGNAQDSATPSWTQVEISQINRYIMLKLNNTVILRYTNTAGPTSGNIMLGYCDAYDSIQLGDSGVIYDNLRVVRLALPITLAQKVGSNMEFTFSWGSDEPITSFKVQTATTVSGAYADDATATVAKLSPGVYKATIPVTGAAATFYRIRYVMP